MENMGAGSSLENRAGEVLPSPENVTEILPSTLEGASIEAGESIEKNVEKTQTVSADVVKNTETVASGATVRGEDLGEMEISGPINWDNAKDVKKTTEVAKKSLDDKIKAGDFGAAVTELAEMKMRLGVIKRDEMK